MEYPFLRKARKDEEEVFRMEEFERNKRNKRRFKSKKLSDAFKRVGEEYERKGYRERAISNYEDSLKYAFNEKDEYKIEEKLNELKARKNSGGLQKRLTFAGLTIASFVIALLFISFNLTGYSIGGLTQENFRFAGTILFLLGLVFVFFYFKNKK